MKKITKIILAVAFGFGFSSCLSDLDNPPIDPNVRNTLNTDGLFAKIYSTMGLTGSQGATDMPDIEGIDEGTSSFYRMIWSLNEFPTDEGLWVWADAGVKEARELSWDATNDLVKGIYARFYFDINLCNFFLKETDALSDEKTLKQKAEVRFIRALNYYYLLDMFGEGVPFAQGIIDRLPLQEEDLPEPISRIKLFEFIESELKDIEEKLYADGEKPVFYRVDQTAAWLLLSRLYLNAEVYTGTAKWNEAATYAAKVMNSSYGPLAPTYKHLFMGNNDVNDSKGEIILPIAQDGLNTRSWGGSIFVIAATRVSGMSPSGITDQWECFRAKNNLVQKFFPNLNYAKTVKESVETMPAAAGDDRCLLESKVDGYEPTLDGGFGTGSEVFKKGWGIAKFSNIYAGGGTSSDTFWPDTDIPFLRSAEAYLNYAEAVVRGATPIEGKTALSAVNALRGRANTTLWTEADLTLDNLLDEWCREFYAEGRRRIDLVRHNKFAGNVNYNWEGKGGTATGKNVDAKYNIYPIPLNDLVANRKLNPSPGYE